MSIIVDTDELGKPIKQETPSVEDKVEQTPEAKPEVSNDEDNLPEKYRGKTAKEIAEMHINAEKLNGRLANELGQYKRHADAWLDKQLEQSHGKASKEDEEDEEIDEITLLRDPNAAVSKVVDKRVKKIEDRLEQRDKAAYEAEFSRRYDVEKYVTDEGFNAWLAKSPTRLRKAEVARDYEGNWRASIEAAIELFDSYDEYKELVTPKEKPAEKPKAPDVSIAHAESAAEVGTAGKSYEFTRSQLLDMRMTDRDKFDRLQPKIIKAIQEGRVLDDLR